MSIEKKCDGEHIVVMSLGVRDTFDKRRKLILGSCQKCYEPVTIDERYRKFANEMYILKEKYNKYVQGRK